MSDLKAERVRGACADRSAAGRDTAFTAIAADTGISRTALYRRRDLRAIVERYRDPTGQALIVTVLADQLDQLRHSLHAVAARVRRHEE